MLRLATLRSFSWAPWPILLAAAGVGLLLSGGTAGRTTLPAFCGAGTATMLAGADWLDALTLAFALNPPGRLLLDWAVMLLAMMPPLLASPIMHVWRSSLQRRRARAIVVFTVGYGALWMTAGPLLIGAALLLQLLAGEGTLSFAIALSLAMVWAASPWQQIALNRGHRLRRIGLFGWAADRECLSFGLVHAGWCIASCWALMLAALIAGPWHIPAMMFAGAAMLSERLKLPEPARWRWPVLFSSFFSLPPRPSLRHSAVRHG